LVGIALVLILILGLLGLLLLVLRLRILRLLLLLLLLLLWVLLRALRRVSGSGVGLASWGRVNRGTCWGRTLVDRSSSAVITDRRKVSIRCRIHLSAIVLAATRRQNSQHQYR
jgi:hypothetical protein